MKITSKNVFTVEDGNHTVAPNLILVVRGNTRRFIFRYSENGKRTDKSLGPARKLSLSDAKALADELRSKLALGEEIKTRRENTPDVPVFNTYAIETIDRLQEV